MRTLFISITFLLLSCFSTPLLSFNPAFYQSEGGAQPIPEEEQTTPDCDECNCTGSPCYPGSGNAFWSDTDLRLNSRTGNLFIQRRYNSNDKSLGAFGWGWSFNYDIRLISAYSGIGHHFIIRLPNGRRVRLLPAADGSGDYLPQRDETDLSSFRMQAKLTHSPGALPCSAPAAFPGAVVQGPFQYCETKYYDYSAEAIYTFGKFGELLSIENSRGTVLLTYDDEGLLSAISDDTGQAITVEWNVSGLIERISYQGDTQIEDLSYNYDNYNNLTTFEDQAGRITTYQYGKYLDLMGLWQPYGDGIYQNPYLHKLAAVEDALGRRLIYFKYYYTDPLDLGYNAPSNEISDFINNGKLEAYTENGLTYYYDYNILSRTATKSSDACPTQQYSMQMSGKGEIGRISYGGQVTVLRAYEKYDDLLKACSWGRDNLVRQNTYDLAKKGNLILSRTYIADQICIGGKGHGCYDAASDKCSPCNVCATNPIEETQTAYVDRIWGSQVKYSKSDGQPGYYYEYASEDNPDTWSDLLGTYLVYANSNYVYDPLSAAPPTPAQGRRTGRYEYGGYGQMTASCEEREVDSVMQEVCTAYVYDGPEYRWITEVHQPRNSNSGPVPISRSAYDNLGRLSTSTDPSGNVSAYTYDALNRLLTSIQPNPGTGEVDGTFTTTYAYYDTPALCTPPNDCTCTDADGITHDDCHLVVQTDANGLITRSFYDEQDQLVEQIQVKDGIVPVRTAYTNGTYGVEKIADANGNYIQYSYDACHNGRIVSMTDNTRGGPITACSITGGSANATLCYGYDNSTGRLRTVTGPRGTLTYGYDARGRQNSKAYDIGNLEFITAYESGTGFVDYVQEKEGGSLKRTTDYIYDPTDGNLLSVINPEGTVSYGYTADGQVKRIDYAANFGKNGGGSIEYQYYAAGNTHNIIQNSGAERALYDYDPRGLMITRQVGAARSEFAYDAQGRLGDITNTYNGSPVSLYSYDYDGTATNPMLGMRTSMTYRDENLVWHGYEYEYDGLYRLKRVTYPSDMPDRAYNGQVHEFTYDDIGNRTDWNISGQGTINYAYDGNSQKLESVTYPGGRAVTYFYDGAGDLVRKTDSAGGIESFEYDALGRMKRYHSFSYDMLMTYDGEGNRARQTRIFGWDHFERKYLYSGEDILFSNLYFPVGRLNQDTLLLHGPGIDEPLVENYFDNVNGTDKKSYLFVDALGSIMQRVEAKSGGLVKFDFDAWGSPALMPPQFDPAWAYGYTGREYFTDQYYFYRARYYEPGIGRFTQVDHIADVSALYLYAENNPIIMIDPWGLEGFPSGTILCRGDTDYKQDVAIVYDDPGGYDGKDMVILVWGTESTYGHPTERACGKAGKANFRSAKPPQGAHGVPDYYRRYKRAKYVQKKKYQIDKATLDKRLEKWIEDHPCKEGYDNLACANFANSMIGEETGNTQEWTTKYCR